MGGFFSNKTLFVLIVILGFCLLASGMMMRGGLPPTAAQGIAASALDAMENYVGEGVRLMATYPGTFQMMDDPGPGSFIASEDPTGTTLVADGSQEYEPPLDFDESTPNSVNGEHDDPRLRFGGDQAAHSGSATTQTHDSGAVFSQHPVLSEHQVTSEYQLPFGDPVPCQYPVSEYSVPSGHPVPSEHLAPAQTGMVDAIPALQDHDGTGFNLDNWMRGTYTAGDRLNPNLGPAHERDVAHQWIGSNPQTYTSLSELWLPLTVTHETANPVRLLDVSGLELDVAAPSLEVSSSRTALNSSFSLDGDGTSDASYLHCIYCPGEFFGARAELWKHYADEHGKTDGKAYRCADPDCKPEQAFMWPKDLRNHMTVHTKAQPFACHCGVKFTRRYNLLRHERNQQH